jgi:hypothetical protein
LPFFLILLFITIIGIPLVPLSIMVFFIIGLLGSAGVSLALGNRLPEAANRDPLVNVVLGSLLISILQSIPIIGVLTWLLLGALSFGSVAITRGGRQHHKPIMQQESLPPE